MSETYTCAACGHKATADRMWNRDRKETSGELEILCGRDSHEVRKLDHRVYRLSETLRRDAERLAERGRVRQAREQYFARFGSTRLSDAIKAAGPARANGNGRQQPALVPPASQEVQEATI